MNIRFSSMTLNGLLVLLLRTNNLLMFQDKFTNCDVIVNYHDFIKSQCRYNILSGPFNIDKELFVSARKFMHSVAEDTPLCHLQKIKDDTASLYQFFVEKMAYLNLLFASHGEKNLWVVPTLPLKVVDFIRSEPANVEQVGSLPMPTSDFITLLSGYSEVVDYLRSNPQILDNVLNYLMKTSGTQGFTLNYRAILQGFHAGEPHIVRSLVQLSFIICGRGVYIET